MLKYLAYYLIFGKPLIMYTGIITLLSFLFTGLAGYLNRRGINLIPIRWHFRMALISIILALFHALLGLSLYFNI